MRVCGKNVFNELDLKKIRKVYLSNNFKDNNIIKKIKENNIKYLNIDSKKLDKMIRNNQGIVMEIDDFEYSDFSTIDNDSLIVILDHIEDPHNFGAIIRTCEARGVKSVIIPKDRSVVVNETVIKTSTGAVSNVNIIMVTNLVNTINKLKDMGYFIYGAEADGMPYNKVSYASKVALIIGSEGKGISKVVRSSCDEIVSIPMKGKVNSLNASVSLAILLYGINID